MNSCVLYYYWNDKIHPNKDMEYPLIPSIASLRLHNKEVPIFVIDASHKDHNWTELEVKHNFKSFKKLATFKENRLLSRPAEFQWFEKQVPFDEIVFCDSDIMWLKDLFPLSCDPQNLSLYETFYKLRGCGGCNTGLIYWNKNSEQAKEALTLWKNVCEKALSDDCICQDMLKKFNFYNSVNDELVMCYILGQIHFNPIPRCENYLLKELPKEASLDCKFSEAKNIHFKADYWPLFKNRGNLCVCIEELRNVFGNLDIFEKPQANISLDSENLFEISDMRIL